MGVVAGRVVSWGVGGETMVDDVLEGVKKAQQTIAGNAESIASEMWEVKRRTPGKGSLASRRRGMANSPSLAVETRPEGLEGQKKAR